MTSKTFFKVYVNKETIANKKGMIAESFLMGGFNFGKGIEENDYLRG
ncbi:MAG: hypothetical protein WCI04_05910 [archaeon]